MLVHVPGNNEWVQTIGGQPDEYVASAVRLMPTHGCWEILTTAGVLRHVVRVDVLGTVARWQEVSEDVAGVGQPAWPLRLNKEVFHGEAALDEHLASEAESFLAGLLANMIDNHGEVVTVGVDVSVSTHSLEV